MSSKDDMLSSKDREQMDWMVNVATEVLEDLEASGMPANLAAGALAMAISLLVENLSGVQELVTLAHQQVSFMLKSADEAEIEKERMN